LRPALPALTHPDAVASERRDPASPGDVGRSRGLGRFGGCIGFRRWAFSSRRLRQHHPSGAPVAEALARCALPCTDPTRPPPRRLHPRPREEARANAAQDTFHRRLPIPWSMSVSRALPPRPDERRFSPARSRDPLRGSREARSPFRGLLWPYPCRPVTRPRFRTPVVSGTTPNALLGDDAGLRLLQHARPASTPRAPPNLARPRSRLFGSVCVALSRHPLAGCSRWAASHDIPIPEQAPARSPCDDEGHRESKSASEGPAVAGSPPQTLFRLPSVAHLWPEWVGALRAHRQAEIRVPVQPREGMDVPADQEAFRRGSPRLVGLRLLRLRIGHASRRPALAG